MSDNAFTYYVVDNQLNFIFEAKHSILIDQKSSKSECLFADTLQSHNQNQYQTASFVINNNRKSQHIMQ